MKIAVVSDIHYARKEFERIIPIVNTCDYFVFCGDGLSNVNALRYEITVPTVCVKGNCDFESGIDTAAVMFGNIKTIVTHGHRFGAKQGMDGLVSLGQSQNSPLVLFGHTHSACDRTVDGVRLINPGAFMDGKFAIVDILGDKITVEAMSAV